MKSAARRSTRKLTARAVSVVALLALLIVLRVFVRNYLAEREDFVRFPPSEISRHPERVGIAGLTEISIPSESGTRIAGWYAPSRNRGAILLVHGTEADRSALIPETRILAAAGFGVLAVDLPGQGASTGRSSWGEPERLAISAAGDWLSRRGDVDPALIGAFGMSMGAYVLTQAALTDQRFKALTLAACPSDVAELISVTANKWGWFSEVPQYLALRAFGMPLDKLPQNIIAGIAPRPILILAGEFDQTVPPYMARKLYARARDPKELWVVPAANHGNYAAAAPAQYAARLSQFYRRALFN